jgi:hypothetical protein
VFHAVKSLAEFSVSTENKITNIFCRGMYLVEKPEGIYRQAQEPPIPVVFLSADESNPCISGCFEI